MNRFDSFSWKIFRHTFLFIPLLDPLYQLQRIIKRKKLSPYSYSYFLFNFKLKQPLFAAVHCFRFPVAYRDKSAILISTRAEKAHKISSVMIYLVARRFAFIPRS